MNGGEEDAWTKARQHTPKKLQALTFRSIKVKNLHRMKAQRLREYVLFDALAKSPVKKGGAVSKEL